MRALVAVTLLLLPAAASGAGWWLGQGGGGTSGQTPITQSIDFDGFDITDADDITGDVFTGSAFVSTCSDEGCGSSLPETTTPTAADSSTVKVANKAKFPVVVQPASGGTSARTASAADAVVTGTGNQVTMVPIFTILAAADGGCAAAGTVDATPSCAREACSNMGLLCHDAINMTSMAAPALAAADCTTETGAGVLLLAACF